MDEPQHSVDLAKGRYSAFISYSHEDLPFVRKLHSRLEAYRLPRRVRGAGDSFRPSSHRLAPVFLDRAELRSAPDLTDVLRVGLAESASLIVVCSPASARSQWVGQEIRTYRELHGDQRIFTALIEGTPDTSFHAELLHSPTGDLRRTPLAADFRAAHDGNRLALLKLIAGLENVRLDELVQRDANRRIRTITLISAASAFGMAVMTILAFTAWQQSRIAVAERDRGERVIEFMITRLRSRLKQIGRLDALNDVNSAALDYYQSQDLARLPTSSLQQRAKVLVAIGEDDEQRGKLLSARANFDEANRTTAALLAADPTSEARVFAHAQSEYWSGYVRWRAGDDAGAETRFRHYAQLAEQLAERDPRNPDWQIEVGYATSNLGVFELRSTGNISAARRHFGIALLSFERAARVRPDDRNLREQIADGIGWLADVERIDGELRSALEYRIRQRTLLELLLAEDRRNFQTRLALVGNALAFARLHIARRQPEEAIIWIEGGANDARILKQVEPEDAEVAARLRMLELMRARAWLAMSPSTRPPLQAIDRAIGNCAHDMQRINGAETAAICTMLQARRALDDGAAASALEAVASGRINTLLRESRLTKHWLFDLIAEANDLGIRHLLDEVNHESKEIAHG